MDLRELYNEFLRNELDIVVGIQKSIIKDYETIWETVIWATNACHLHMFFIPLLLVFGLKVYMYFTLTAIFSAMSSVWFKWLIAADRPYWWIYQGGPYETVTRPPLEQRLLTCETTPGMPSSEIALLFSMLYLIVSGQVGRSFDYLSFAPSSSFIRSQIFYGGASFALFAIVAISQLFYATHFLHQCYFGIIFGVTISHLIIRNNLLEMIGACSRAQALCLFLLVALASLVFYGAAYVIVGDPRWSTHRAFNWCLDPYSVRPDRTGPYWIVYNLGLLFGFLFCLPLTERHIQTPEPKRLILGILTVMAANTYLNDLTPRHFGVIVFYLATFLLNMTYVICLVKVAYSSALPAAPNAARSRQAKSD